MNIKFPLFRRAGNNLTPGALVVGLLLSSLTGQVCAAPIRNLRGGLLDILEKHGLVSRETSAGNEANTVQEPLVTGTVSSASNPSVSTQTTAPAGDFVIPGFDDHSERWVSVYDNPNGHTKNFSYPIGIEVATAQVISPDGSRVYVTGYSWDNSTQSQQWATVEFDTSTGARGWVTRYGAPGIYSFPYDIAVSPDGGRIYVVGQQYRQQQGTFFSEGTTIAYDAATGHQLWLERYQMPFADADMDHVAVSPDGHRVYVSGSDTAGGDFGRAGVSRYVTIAYSAATGSQDWVAFHDEPELQGLFPYNMVLDPAGARVYVGGSGGIVAYDARTGGELWETNDLADALAIAPDGTRLFTSRPHIDNNSDRDLVAYVAATGKISWSAPLGITYDFAPPLAVDPGGARVYVATEQSVSGTNTLFQHLDAVTQAFEARSGTLVWTTHFHDGRVLVNAEEEPWGLAASPDGKRLYLAVGAKRDGPAESAIATNIVTIAYDTAEGSQKWIGNYSASPDSPDEVDLPAVPFPASRNIGVTPDGSKVIVAGLLNHHPFGRPNDLYPRNWSDYVVLAYDTPLSPEVRALKAVSRKVHGAAGAFDLEGVECRSGGPNNNYQLVLTFPGPVTFGRAAVTSGTGSVKSTSTHGAEVTINLTGVANAQTIALTLFGVSDGVKRNDVTVPFSVLIGDITGGGSVGDFDLRIVSFFSGQTITDLDFRLDVTTNGFIGKGDVSLVQSKIGTVLPPHQ